MHNVGAHFLSLSFIEISFVLAMKSIIFSNLLKSSEQHRPIVINKRHRNPTANTELVKAHFTPIIELKPILSNSTSNDQSNHHESIRKVTKIISTNTIQKDSARINTIVSFP